MKKIWSDKAWEDYLYWQTQDKKKRSKESMANLSTFFLAMAITKTHKKNSQSIWTGNFLQKQYS